MTRTLAFVAAGALAAVTIPVAHAAPGPPDPGCWHHTATIGEPGYADMYPTGIEVADDGTVYVGDAGRYQLAAFDADRNSVARWGEYGNGPGQFKGPRAIAVDPSGRVLVGVTGGATIQRFTPTGELLDRWGTFGDGPGEFGSIRGLAVHPDGERLYAVDAPNHRLQILDVDTGAYLGEVGPIGSDDGQWDSLRDVTFDESGRWWVVDARGDTVYAFDADNRPAGTVRPPDLNYPGGLAYGAGVLYLVDRGGHSVHMLDRDGAHLGTFGGRGSDPGQFDGPRGITVAPDGTVYVTDMWNFRVQRFTPTGVFLEEWGGRRPPPGGLNLPRDVTVDPGTGDRYVVEWWNQRVQRFDRSGRPVLVWGQRGGDRPGELNFPSSVTWHPSGEIVVADTETQRIVRHRPDGTFVARFASQGSGPGQIRFVRAIAPDPAGGGLYVLDTLNHRVQVLTLTGGFVRAFGTHGTALGEFGAPQGLTVADDGTVWVADTGNHRVQAFTADGEPVVEFGGPGTAPGRFNQPRGVAVIADRVYVADAGNDRVQVFDRSGRFIADWTVCGGVLAELDDPHNVRVGPAGEMLIVDTRNHRVLELVAPSVSSVSATVEGGAVTVHGEATSSRVLVAVRRLADGAWLTPDGWRRSFSEASVSVSSGGWSFPVDARHAGRYRALVRPPAGDRVPVTFEVP